MQHLQKTRGWGQPGTYRPMAPEDGNRLAARSTSLLHEIQRPFQLQLSFAPFGKFNSCPRPDSIKYAVSAPSAAPSAACFLSLCITPFTAPLAAPAAAASAASCCVLDRPSINPACSWPGFTLCSPGTLTTSATIGSFPNLVRISSNVNHSFARPATPAGSTRLTCPPISAPAGR